MIKLADIFQSGMTLQRQKDFNIFGTSDKADKIAIVLNGVTLAEQPIRLGKFVITCPMQSEMTNAEINVVGENTISLKDVDFGEVWIAGGQSNMEFLLSFEKHYEEELKSVNDPHLRFYDVPEYSFEGEEKDGYKNIYGWGRWLKAEKESVGDFSAVGYYFGKELRANLNVPVAIVGCNWGGTTAATWLDRRILEEDELLRFYVDDYENGLKTLDIEEYNKKNDASRKLFGTRFAKTQMEHVFKHSNTFLEKALMPIVRIMYKERGSLLNVIGPRDPNRPGALYEMMLKKITDNTFRGVIWYQGENDTEKYSTYARLFGKMVDCWRASFKDDLPFITVQLAPFGSWMGNPAINYNEQRRQQDMATKIYNKVYMCSIMDDGSEIDVHPKNKRIVGERLSFIAENKVYGENVKCDAPEFASAEKDGDTITIEFANAEELHLKGEGINSLELSVNGTPIEYKYKIDKNVITLKSNLHIKGDVKIRFADENFCQVNLYNEANLSAKPFVTEIE